VDRGFLNESELKSLETKKLTANRLEYVRDLFVFSCYTGLAYIDVMQLSTGNILLGTDQEYWIFTKRKKTENTVRIPILPKAFMLIEKYKCNPKSVSADKIFPPISNQKINDYLKEIATLCCINKNLTFHIARHTFATTVTLTNGVPIESVSKMLGHSKLSTTQVYARVIEQKLSQDMKALRGKLYPSPEKEGMAI
jgi:site-specific recombinase XerD